VTQVKKKEWKDTLMSRALNLGPVTGSPVHQVDTQDKRLSPYSSSVSVLSLFVTSVYIQFTFIITWEADSLGHNRLIALAEVSMLKFEPTCRFIHVQLLYYTSIMYSTNVEACRDGSAKKQ